jgi:hypothetical protein
MTELMTIPSAGGVSTIGARKEVNTGAGVHVGGNMITGGGAVVGGDNVAGDQVAGHKITVGDLSGTGVGIG